MTTFVNDCDDMSVGSTNSAASSVHEIIVSETDRRKERVNRIRERRRQQQRPTEKSNDDSSSLSSSSSSIAGIMTVRTLDESLFGGRVSEMRKLRRKVTIKFKNPESAAASSLASDEEISVYSTMSDISLGFAHVYIREYEIVPGNNPSCSKGPPIELGWAHIEHSHMDFEKYEDVRDGRRRLHAQMRMPTEVRKSLLLHHGSSQKMIRDATRSAAIHRKQRMQTIHNLDRGGIWMRLMG